MTVSFHKFGDYFFPGTGDVKVKSCDDLFRVGTKILFETNYILYFQINGGIWGGLC